MEVGHVWLILTEAKLMDQVITSDLWELGGNNQVAAQGPRIAYRCLPWLNRSFVLVSRVGDNRVTDPANLDLLLVELGLVPRCASTHPSPGTVLSVPRLYYRGCPGCIVSVPGCMHVNVSRVGLPTLSFCRLVMSARCDIWPKPSVC